MGYENANLTIEKDVKFIKPSKPTPTTILSLSTIDNFLSPNFFTQSIHLYRSINHSSKLEPARVIKEALSKALFYYYPFAGKLVRHADGKLRVHCTSDGVPFIEAICHCDLSSLNYLDDNDVEIGKNLSLDFPSHDEFGNQYPLVLMMTKFLCGGFAIVIGSSHAIVDGSGMAQFLRAVAELASGKTEPSLKPVWERERLVGTITSEPMQSPVSDEGSIAVSPFMPTMDFSHECSKIDGDSINRLKTSLKINSEVITKMTAKGFTTFESLTAYIWRARARALKLSYDRKTMLIIVVSVKPHLLDPLPEGYYGNSLVQSYVVQTVRELNEKPLLEVVKLVRESIRNAFTNDYIRHSINTMETKSMKHDYESGAVTVVTDWRHLGFFEKVDFGWKEKPVNNMPVPCDMYGALGLCSILSPTNLDPSMNGGARVYTSLPRLAMPKFKQEMDNLRHIENA
ncbi:spermidine coumaroyl-CoA acyltransferase-like [Abrus precatorius]|uniref:Spermidine coumaroyl-CoA acyltransferase-like n=1 Tax=Abrus precatorius TaxID=3816 RepID=A0A8B8KSG8_ABRPR|nr:spermidine coumaroyl-CoA acyltransferase-like [Abrus precatorius]